MTTPLAWAAALDAYETRLNAVRDALASGDLAGVPPFLPPDGLGTMPSVAVERAVALLERSRELERLVDRALSVVADKLEQRPTQPAPRRASRLDVTV
ncbi:hypothetical protein [Euzebya rosea]|uniref:hypothetical protein n=1 Tax=Euzebya rosea TaxID=2052804 RepID=UPI000D3E71BF|nr:hypothetical protein [Euzebya rosea]